MGGVNFTLVPITKEQERIQAGTRTRAGRAVRQAPTLLLLTLFQLLAALQLILGGCDAALELTAFGGLIGLEWALYLGLRIFRRTGFEAETLAFFPVHDGAGGGVELRAGESGQGAAGGLRGRVRVSGRLLVAARSGTGEGRAVSGRGGGHGAAGVQPDLRRGEIRRAQLDPAGRAFVPAVGVREGVLHLRRRVHAFAADGEAEHHSVYRVFRGDLRLSGADEGFRHGRHFFFVAFLVIAFLRSGNFATIALPLAATGVRGGAGAAVFFFAVCAEPV